MAPSVAVIGAGMAGLTCARRLIEAGLSPVVFDKGRGIGGRLATRRGDHGLQFDHGAQYVTATSRGFQAVLDEMVQEGIARSWQDDVEGQHLVGVPGMSALAKYIARGLDVRQNAEITSVACGADGWQITIGDGAEVFDRVVITSPAPQTVVLLGADHPVSTELSDVSYAPCLTLMLAVDGGEPAPFVTRREPDNPIAWIAQDSSKPGRQATSCWVAQAGSAWSLTHLERPKEEIAALMIPMVCDRLGIDAGAVTHSAAHRWRYAHVTRPLGRPFVQEPSGTLFAGGDWCLGPSVEAAWTSGDAIATRLLADL